MVDKDFEMPFDVKKYIEEKEQKQQVEDLNFNFSVFSNKGVLSNGYYLYYLFLWGFYIRMFNCIPYFLFGECSFTTFCIIVATLFGLYFDFNITCKRLTDIYGTYQYNKWLAVIFMIPFINFFPLFAQGKITNQQNTLTGENKNFTVLYGFIKPKHFWLNNLYLILILLALTALYLFAFTNTDINSRDFTDLEREIVTTLVLWLIWFFANINKFKTYKKQDNNQAIQLKINDRDATTDKPEPKQYKFNYKNGFKRIFLALGYFIFCMLGLALGSETSFISGIIGAIIGFFLFKYLGVGIKWIIEGFKQ